MTEATPPDACSFGILHKDGGLRVPKDAAKAVQLH